MPNCCSRKKDCYFDKLVESDKEYFYQLGLKRAKELKKVPKQTSSGKSWSWPDYYRYYHDKNHKSLVKKHVLPDILQSLCGDICYNEFAFYENERDCYIGLGIAIQICKDAIGEK